MNERAVI